jgi:hypothetical protein
MVTAEGGSSLLFVIVLAAVILIALVHSLSSPG